MKRFNYQWRLSDGFPYNKITNHKKKVFGTFVCGGGSTMGYKLAGYEHLGGVELDPQVANIYKTNHNPQIFYNCDLRKFNKMNNLPDALYNLDLLDGSPPCSSFSMAGNRDKDWGKNKKFREGQKNQKLDDLVFVYCKTIKKLNPKVFILENVKGLAQGNAKGYLKKCCSVLSDLGYRLQVFIINSASLGVPQKRERVFIIGLQNKFKLPKLKLKFNEKPILLKEFCENHNHNDLTSVQYNLWKKQTSKCRSFADVRKAPIGFTDYLLSKNEIIPTIKSKGLFILKDQPRWLTKSEFSKAGSFPLDYNFLQSKPQYLIGMSVPPIMTAQISYEIFCQWLSKI